MCDEYFTILILFIHFIRRIFSFIKANFIKTNAQNGYKEFLK